MASHCGGGERLVGFPSNHHVVSTDGDDGDAGGKKKKKKKKKKGGELLGHAAVHRCTDRAPRVHTHTARGPLGLLV